MLHVARRAGLIITVAVLALLLVIAGSSARVGPAGAQAPAVIQGAGLFTFPGNWSAVPDQQPASGQ
jgi:hypothetical protein